MRKHHQPTYRTEPTSSSRSSSRTRGAGLPLLFTTLSLCFTYPVHAAEEETYMITFAEEIKEELIAEQGGAVVDTYEFMPVALAELTEDEADTLLEHESVEHVEADEKVNVDPLPELEEGAEKEDAADTSGEAALSIASEQTVDWALERINVPAAWENGLTGEGVSVAVVDTGIMHEHPDLNVTDSVSFVEGAEDAEDDNGHGTHVAGIISALDNDEGIIGVAPDTELYAAKVLDEEGSGYHSWVVRGIDWAVQNDVDIINLSVGGDQHSDTLASAVEHAYAEGAMIVAAAGNRGSGNDQIEYPARYDEVIAVGATNRQDERAAFSATGPSLDIVAPGQNILSAHNDGSYIRDSGTSMAAPHVSGHLALLQQAEPEATNTELRELLYAHTQNLGLESPNHLYGHGLTYVSSELEPPANEVEPNPEPDSLEAYDDVDRESWSYSYLADLYERNYISGYPNNTMRPTASITRAEAAVLLVRATNAFTSDGSHDFTDIPDGYYAEGAIEAAATAGLISGYNDGTFRPAETITRGETSAMFARAYTYSGSQASDFSDVPEDYFAASAIQSLARAGIIEGYPNGTFGPRENVSRAEYAAFLSRTLEQQ